MRRLYRLCHCRRRLHHGRPGESHCRLRPHPRRGRVVVIQKQKHLNQVIVHFVVVIVVDFLVVIIRLYIYVYVSNVYMYMYVCMCMYDVCIVNCQYVLCTNIGMYDVCMYVYMHVRVCM